MAKEENLNPLAVDTNKWVQLITEAENPKNATQWKNYLEEYDFDIILPHLVLKELLWILTNKEKKSQVWRERERCLLQLMNVRQTFDFKYVKISKELEYYYLKAEMLMKKYYIKPLLKSKGLYKTVDGTEKYYLHKDDLAILISLKELNKPYYFITHDGKLMKALQVEEIRNILIAERIHFILLHETQKVKNRKVTRIKVLPDKI